MPDMAHSVYDEIKRPVSDPQSKPLPRETIPPGKGQGASAEDDLESSIRVRLERALSD